MVGGEFEEVKSLVNGIGIYLDNNTIRLVIKFDGL